MASTPISHLSQIASFLKVPSGKISLNEEGQIMRVSNKNTTLGFQNIVFQLIKETNNTNIGGINHLETAEIRQWIEYALVYIAKADFPPNLHQILKELNLIFATRTYLVSQKLTVSDILFYYILQNAMENLTSLEKEGYLNVSRWFDNLQQNPSIRQSNKTIDFSTNYLLSAIPARH